MLCNWDAHFECSPQSTAARLREFVSNEVAHICRKLICWVGLWLTRKLTYLHPGCRVKPAMLSSTKRCALFIAPTLMFRFLPAPSQRQAGLVRQCNLRQAPGFCLSRLSGIQ